jgi:hypothetical protein
METLTVPLNATNYMGAVKVLAVSETHALIADEQNRLKVMLLYQVRFDEDSERPQGQ